MDCRTRNKSNQELKVKNTFLAKSPFITNNFVNFSPGPCCFRKPVRTHLHNGNVNCSRLSDNGLGDEVELDQASSVHVIMFHDGGPETD